MAFIEYLSLSDTKVYTLKYNGSAYMKIRTKLMN